MEAGISININRIICDVKLLFHGLSLRKWVDTANKKNKCICWIILSKGNFKCFGLNKNETIFPFWLVTTIIGLFTYYILIIRKEYYL